MWNNSKMNVRNIFILLDKISLGISKSLINISAIAVVIWPIIMVIYIVLRNLGTTWLFVEEFTEYWLVMTVYFSIAYTLRKKGHICVDMLINYLPLKSKKVTKSITEILSLYVVIYLIIMSIDWTIYGFLNNAKSSFTSNIILWPVYLFIPVGLVSFGLELLINLLKNINIFHNK